MKSLYQQQEKSGKLPPNVVKCSMCNGKGHVGVGVCVNCEGAGGVLAKRLK